jgi:hypothetical protein
MTRQVIFLLTILLTACEQNSQSSDNLIAENKSSDSLRPVQTYFVNDIVQKVEPTKIFHSKPITEPKIVFIEKEFTLSVSKTDLIEALKIDSQQSGKDFENIFTTVINYLSSTDSLTFDYIWTRSDAFDNISVFETDKLGARNLTKKILKETICTFIENGGFEIFQNNVKNRNYFFERVDSDYGGNVNGVFTSNKRLIWICPPFIIE